MTHMVTELAFIPLQKDDLFTESIIQDYHIHLLLMFEGRRLERRLKRIERRLKKRTVDE